MIEPEHGPRILHPFRKAGQLFAAAACLLLIIPVCSVAGGEGWTRVRSRNFLVVGNAGEPELRETATHLEQFRAICSFLLVKDQFDSPVPTTVVVFRDDASYRPFIPLSTGQPAGVAGYFQHNTDVNYITLSLDEQHGKNSFSLVFHEYVHLLVKNIFPNAPAWFNEGLAEYYSTFEMLDGDRKLALGKPISGRVFSLRGHELLPLQTLTAADYNSPYYNEHDKRDIFYSESWALVHYLLNGNGGRRRAQLSRYLDLLSAGASNEEAFRQAFETDFTKLENELRDYIHLGRYEEQFIAFGKQPEFDRATESAPLTEADTEAYLGDLLLHIGRAEEAEKRLQRAVALDPNLAPAQASLGMALMRQNRLGEAKQHLERAIATGPQNYLVHYYYAYVLSSESMGMTDSGRVQTREEAQAMYAELKRAIELAPDFTESYRLLAIVEMVRGEHLREATAVLRYALSCWPKRQDLAVLLAQVYLARKEYGEARRVLEPMVGQNRDWQIRAQAQSALDAAKVLEEFDARFNIPKDTGEADEDEPAETQPCDIAADGAQQKRLRFKGEQRCGLLEHVECEEGGMTLYIKAGDRTLKFYSEAPEQVRFVTYTTDVRGRLTCGASLPTSPVLVTYRAAKDNHAGTDGELIAIEFLPQSSSH